MINSLPSVCSHAIRTILMVWVRITLGFQPRVIRTQTINIFSYCMNKQGITNNIIPYYHFISYHFIPYHIISYHVISYHIISYHIISYHIISYHIISYHEPFYYHAFFYHMTPALQCITYIHEYTSVLFVLSLLSLHCVLSYPYLSNNTTFIITSYH